MAGAINKGPRRSGAINHSQKPDVLFCGRGVTGEDVVMIGAAFRLKKNYFNKEIGYVRQLMTFQLTHIEFVF